MKIFQEGMFKQIMGLLKTHILAAVLGTFLSFLCMGMYPKGSGVFKVFAILFLVLYMVVLYIKAWECAEYDKKAYSTTSVYMLKGAVLSVGILILNYVLWAFYVFSWNFLEIDGVVATTTGMIYNVAYVINTFMYADFAVITKGVVSWQAHLMIVFVPMIASLLGYIAGVKGLVLSEKLLPFVYERRKNKKEQ